MERAVLLEQIAAWSGAGAEREREREENERELL